MESEQDRPSDYLMARMFTQRRTDGTLRQATRLRQALQRASSLDKAYERMDDPNAHGMGYRGESGNRSLRDLPGSRLPLGVTLGAGKVLVCDLVEVDEIEKGKLRRWKHVILVFGGEGFATGPQHERMLGSHGGVESPRACE